MEVGYRTPFWWDPWLRAVLSTSKFFGLDASAKLEDPKLDAEDVCFTIEFDTPEPPRTIDAVRDVFALEEPSLVDGEWSQ